MAPATATALLPQPRSVHYGHGWLPVTGAFRVEWLGYHNAVLERAVSRFQIDVARRTGIDVRHVGAATLRINCRGEDKGFLTIDAREHYSLAINDDAVLATDGPAGVLRGLATLRQAITNVPEGFAIPAMAIDDAPRFAWRGIMIDVTRHFFSLPTLKRQIDLMELVKLNVLHLHLSDNEGFRVESRRFSKLQEVSSQGQFYRQAEIQELVSYAADRGVRIVPEFDVPGHSLAILRAYPEFASGNIENRDYFSAMGSALNPANPQTFTFLDRLFGEMATLFPDQYFHVGGDEISGADWESNSQVQDFMKTNGLKTKAELESYFFKRVRESVRAHGKTVIGWEEVGRNAIPDDVVVQTWRSSKAIAKATAKGNRVIVSGGYYFPGEDYYRVDPLDPTAHGRTPEQVAEAKAKGLPAAIIAEEAIIDPSLKLSPAQQALVLGGEGCIWTEIVTEEMLDGRLWPAAAIVAERFWSPASLRDTTDMYRRLIVVQDGLRLAGLADDANLRRMAARLAPGESEPVALLLGLVAPVCTDAHYHAALAILKKQKAPPQQEFNELADAALPDSLVARRFQLDAERFVRGDRSDAAALKANLVSWRDNHDRFTTIARGKPRLEVALPVSGHIAALAGIGLDAVAAIESGRAPDAEWRRRAKGILDRQAAYQKASENIIEVLTMQQPPADLLIAITPGIRKLVEAADRIGK